MICSSDRLTVAAACRSASAILKEWHEDWVTGRRYLRMKLLENWDRDPVGESAGDLHEAA